MSVQFIKTDFAGQAGVNPRLVRLISTDDYETITSANYLLPVIQQGYPINPTDYIFMAYGANQFGIFTPAITPESITLNPYMGEGNVALPVVNNNLTSFDGTTGKIKDSGIASDDVQLINSVAQALTWAGGGTSHAFTLTGVTASSIVVPAIKSSDNPVSISGCSVSTDTLTITFSDDPGAVTLNVIAYISPQ